MQTHFKSYTFRNPHNGNECSLNLDFNTLAILNNELEFEIKGWSFNSRKGIRSDIFFLVKYNASENTIQIIHDETVLKTINLNGNILTGDIEDMEADQAYDAILDLEGMTNNNVSIEDIFDKMPAFDPILGCLIKSAISTTVGQIINCHNNLENPEGAKQRIKQMLKCLGHNKWSMVSKFAIRTLRCMVFFGWDIL